MALIKCPECENNISDKAYCCPQCGYPITAINTVTKRRKSQSKKKKLPNGFGSITEIKNQNLRNPFYARKTVGKDAFGKPILKPLKPNAYFLTYNDAYTALVEYNANPYDLNADILVSELYEKWSDTYFSTLKSMNSIRTITSAWAYCSSIYSMRAKDIRARHIKGCMEDGFVISKVAATKGQTTKASAHTKSRIKSLFNLMLDYALEYEIIDRNYARTFDVSQDILDEKESTKRGHIIVTDDELITLWDNYETIKFVDMVLVQCYTGLRPQELAIIELSEVNLDDWYFQTGMKTDAGKNRIIPIHTRIRDLVSKYYKEALELNSTSLFNDVESKKGGIKMTYDKYRRRFEKIIKVLNLNPEHRPHDPRKTFVTMAKKTNVDEYAIKLIVGHAINDITEKVYTERDIKWLKNEIEKIR